MLLGLIITYCLLSDLVKTLKVSITYRDSLIAGSSTTLTCTVEDYSVSGLDIGINITWLSSQAALSNDDERVMISESSESLSTFTSHLTFSPLSAKDTNITCSATAYLVSPRPFIDKSSVKTKDIVLLTIEGIPY